MNFINNFLNEWIAWIATAIGVFLAFKYIFRKSIQVDTPFRSNLMKVNKYSKKYHIFLGIILIILGLVHGLISSVDIISFNYGTICWLISILLGLNWYIRKKLYTSGLWIKHHRYLTVLFLLTLGLHLIEIKFIDINFNNILPKKTISNKDIITGDLSKYDFIDGTYEGIANGFGPNLTLEVTINSNKLVDISIISHNEKNERYFGPPMNLIPTQIIENQNLNVDALSGATYTSTGIVNAVKDALSKSLAR